MLVHGVTRKAFLLTLTAALVLVSGGCFAFSPRQPPNSAVYTVPGDIQSGATCSPTMPEVSAQMQAWLDSLPNGAIAQLGAKRCYRTELPLMIRAKTGFTLDGNGSKLQAFTDGCDDQSDDGIKFNDCRYTWPFGPRYNWPRNRTRISLDGNRNVTVRNIYLDGGHLSPGPDGAYVPEYEAQHAFDLAQNDGVLIEAVHADRVYGDYVYISGGKNITVQNSVFGEDNGTASGNGRQGLAIVNGASIKIAGNRIMNVRRSSIDIEPYSTGAVIKDVTIQGNTFGRARLNWFANGGVDAVVENVYLDKNRLVGKSFSVNIVTPKTPDPGNPADYRRRNFQFLDNTSDTEDGNPYGSVVGIMGIDGVVIRGAAVRVQPGRNPPMGLVEFKSSRNIQVVGNSTLNAQQTGRFTVSGTGAALNNANYCERDNLIGNPLVKQQSSGVPICPA